MPGIPGTGWLYGYAGWWGWSPDNAGWPTCGWLCGNPIAKLLLKAANLDRDAEVLRRLNLPVVPPIGGQIFYCTILNLIYCINKLNKKIV